MMAMLRRARVIGNLETVGVRRLLTACLCRLNYAGYVTDINHDKPKAHFWEPNIIACRNEAFRYSLIDLPRRRQRRVQPHADSVGTGSKPHPIFPERRKDP